MNDLTKSQLIELIGAVFFRVWGFVTFVNGAIVILTQTFSMYAMNHGGGFQYLYYGATQFIISASVSALLFFFAIPLSRNLCSGLVRVLDPRRLP